MEKARDGIVSLAASFLGIHPGSAQGQTNDGASPVRSARPTRSPTQCHQPSDTPIDLTPSTQSRTYTAAQYPTTDTKALRRGPLSDVRRLVPGFYKAPTDAVVLPKPEDFFKDFLSKARDMGKPGAELSHRPINSIDRGSSRPTTYGKPYSTPTKFFDFLDQDPATISAPGSHSSVAEHEPPAKRRRLETLLHAGTPSIHGDNGVRKKRGAGGAGGLLPHNEYYRTEKLASTRPRRKSSFVSRESSNAYENGAMITNPIVLDEDSFSKSNHQHHGNSPDSDRNRRDPTPETTSRFFQNHEIKISQSTGASRTVPFKGDLQDSVPLRHRFKRSEQAAQEEISEDELAQAPLQKRTSRSRTTAVLTEIRRIPSTGYELKYARTPEFEGHEPDLSLRAGKENSYRIAGRVGENISTAADIPLAKVNMAQTDNISRLRLTGPLNADKTQLLVDLEFKSMKDLLLFMSEVSRSITQKAMHCKEESYMARLFLKPLAPTIKASAVSSSGFDSKSTTGTLTQRQRGGLLAVQQHSETAVRHKTGSDSDDFSALKRLPADRVTRATCAKKPAYSEVEEEEPVNHVQRYSEVHGLGTPWQHQLTYGSGRHRATVDFADLVRLDEGEFLNDQLIDFYLLWLLNQTEGLSDKVYIFNTHFFSTLTRKVPGHKGSINYAAVERWTAKEDLFGYDYIVVPINQDVHWYVAIICNVSSIARKPAIEGTRSPSPATSEVPKNAPEVEEQSATIFSDTETLPTNISTAGGIGLDKRNETFGDEPEDCSLDLVDGDAIGLQIGPEKGTETVVLDSDASETARMRQLSLAEATPDKNFAFLDLRPSSKKSRRRSGPPAKRWNPDEPTIIILDSLASGARSQAVRALKDYLRAEGVAKRGMEVEILQNAFYAKDTHIPIQENFYDCGVYLLGYMQKFFEDPDKFKNQLLLGEMQAQSSWTQRTMPQIRDQMRDILKNLYQHQEAERKRVRAKKRAKKAAAVSQAVTPANQGPAAIDKQPHSSKSATPKESEEPSKASAGGLATAEPLRLGSPFQPASERSARRSSSPAPVLKVDDSPLSPATVFKVDDSPIPPTQGSEPHGEHVHQCRSDGKPDMEGDPENEGRHDEDEPDADAKPNIAEKSFHNYQSGSTTSQAPGTAGIPRTRKPSPVVVIRSPKRAREPNTTVTNGIVERTETTEARNSSPKRQRTESRKPRQTNLGKTSTAMPKKNTGLWIPFPQVVPPKSIGDDRENSDHDASPPRSRGRSRNPISLDESQEEIVVLSAGSRPTDKDDRTHPADPSAFPGQEPEAFQASLIELDQHSPVPDRHVQDGAQSESFIGHQLDAQLLLAHQSIESMDNKIKSLPGDESQTTIEDDIWVGVSTPGAQKRASQQESPGARASTVAETPPGARSSPGATYDDPWCI